MGLTQARAATFPAKSDLATAQSRTIAVGKTQRHYLVQPAAGESAAPIVIVLHGHGQTAEQTWRQTSLATLGLSQHFILVVPDAIDHHWNDTRTQTLSGVSSQVDDLGFLRALIAEIVARDHGDPQAVFLTGISNGGFMTEHAACAMSGDFRAVAIVAALMIPSVRMACHPDHPMPVLLMNGTEDHLIPMAGRGPGVVAWGRTLEALMSADATFAFWADLAGCNREITKERIAGPTGSDWAERRTRSGCIDGSVSEQMILHGGGHTWPGMPDAPAERLLGGSNQAVDAGTELWRFFNATLKR